MHDSTAEAEAAGEPEAERTHVAVSVTASPEQVYKTIKVIFTAMCCCMQSMFSGSKRLHCFTLDSIFSKFTM